MIPLEKRSADLILQEEGYPMSFNSLSSIRLFDVSTYLVEQMQRFFPNEALDRVNSKIDLIRSGIAGMSSSAISLYSSNPDSSSISGPVKVIGINRLMQGVDEAQIHVPGEAIRRPLRFCEKFCARIMN